MCLPLMATEVASLLLLLELQPGCEQGSVALPFQKQSYRMRS